MHSGAAPALEPSSSNIAASIEANAPSPSRRSTPSRGVALAAIERAQKAASEAATKASAIEAKTQNVEEVVGGIKQELFTMRQAAVRHGGGGVPVGQKSWGEQFIESEGLKEFAADTSRPRRYRLDVKTTITTGSTSGGPLTPPDRDTTNAMPKRRLQVRSLLNVISVTGNSVEYPRQTTRTNAAAPVAEGSAKPESAYAFELAAGLRALGPGE